MKPLLLALAGALATLAPAHAQAQGPTPQLVVQTGHKPDSYGSVEGLAFSPDGQWLASGAGGEGTGVGQLFIWNRAGQLWAREDGVAAVQDLAWSHNSRFVALADTSGATVFERASARVVGHVAFGNGNPQTTNGASRIQCLDDGRVAVLIDGYGGTQQARVFLCDWRTGAKTELWRGVNVPYGPILRLSPDGSLLALATREALLVFDLHKGGAARVLKHPFSLHTGMDTFFAPFPNWSPDGRFVGGVSEDHIGVWDLTSGELRLEPTPSDYRLPSGLALDNEGRVVWEWKADRDKDADRLERFGADGKKSVVLRAPSPFEGQSEMATAFDEGARRWAVAGIEGDISLYDGNTGQLTKILPNGKQWANAVSFSSDSAHLCVGYGRRTYGGSFGELAVYDLHTGDLVTGLAVDADESGETMGVTDAKFSPDGRFLVCTGQTRDDYAALSIFDGDDLRRLTNAALLSGRGCKIAWSGDGRSFAVGSYGGEVSFYHDFGRVTEGKINPDWTTALIPRGSDVTDLVMGLAVSPRNHLVVAGLDTRGTRRLMALNDTTGKVIKTLPAQADVFDVVFSLDETRFWTGETSGEVSEWDARTLQKTRTLQKAGDFCPSLALAADGRSLFVARNAGVAQIALDSGRVLRLFPPASRELNQIAASKDGRWLAGADEMGTATLWNARTGARVLAFERVRVARTPKGDVQTQALTRTPAGAVLTSGVKEPLALWRLGEELLTQDELAKRGFHGFAGADVVGALNP